MCACVLPLTRALDNLGEAKQGQHGDSACAARWGPAQASRERKRGGTERKRWSQQTGALHKAEHTAVVCEAASSSLLHQPPCCLVPSQPSHNKHVPPCCTLALPIVHERVPQVPATWQHTHTHTTGAPATKPIHPSTPISHTLPPCLHPHALNRCHHHALLLLNCCCYVLTAAPRAAEWCSADLSTHTTMLTTPPEEAAIPRRSLTAASDKKRGGTAAITQLHTH